MSIETARKAEHDKYVGAYNEPYYKMGHGRMMDAIRDLQMIPNRGSYLDVGCGRGEMLQKAREQGFGPEIMGCEVVPDLINGKDIVQGEVHSLPFPDKSFDIVTMFDVIEHLLPGDDELACREMLRVARKHILLTANNRPSHMPDGTDLHINIRPYEEWNDLFMDWFDGSHVVWLKHARQFEASQGWRIDLL